MSQITYGVLGLTAAALVSFSLMRSPGSSSDELISNEVVMHMLYVGQDVLEDISQESLPFDGNVNAYGTVRPVSYTVVRDPSQLTAYGAFGGCGAIATCDDLDDLDGLSFVQESDGVQYEVSIEVRYVEPTAPYAASTVPTFAKQLNILVSTPSITIGGRPLTVGYARVFKYDTATGASLEVR